MRRKMRKERVRRGYSEAQRAEMGERWGRGESLKAIGRLFGKEGGSVYGQLAPYGGIHPRPRCRSPLALTLAEREEISRGVAAGLSMRCTSRLLGRSASTVSREIGRNGGGSAYRATEAEERAWGRARLQDAVGFRVARSCGNWSKSNCGCTGRPNRSPAG